MESNDTGCARIASLSINFMTLRQYVWLQCTDGNIGCKQQHYNSTIRYIRVCMATHLQHKKSVQFHIQVSGLAFMTRHRSCAATLATTFPSFNSRLSCGGTSVTWEQARASASCHAFTRVLKCDALKKLIRTPSMKRAPNEDSYPCSESLRQAVLLFTSLRASRLTSWKPARS